MGHDAPLTRPSPPCRPPRCTASLEGGAALPCELASCPPGLGHVGYLPPQPILSPWFTLETRPHALSSPIPIPSLPSATCSTLRHFLPRTVVFMFRFDVSSLFPYFYCHVPFFGVIDRFFMFHLSLSSLYGPWTRSKHVPAGALFVSSLLFLPAGPRSSFSFPYFHFLGLVLPV